MKLINLLQNSRLNTRLMILFMLVSFVPVLISSIFTLSFFYQINVESAKNNLHDKLGTINLIYQKKGYDIEQTVRLVSEDNLVRVNLALGLHQPVSNYLKTVVNSKQLSFLSVLDAGGSLIISGNEPYIKPGPDPVLAAELLKIAGGTGDFSGTIIIDSPNFLETEGIEKKQAVALVSISPVRENDDTVKGYIFGGYILENQPSPGANDTLLREMKKTISTDVLFIHNGRILSYSDPSAPFKEIKLPDNLETTDYSSGMFTDLEIRNRDYIFSFVQVKVYGSGSTLLMGSGMPVSRFMQVQRQAGTALTVIALFAMIIAAVSAFFISRSISRPILKMVEGTKNIVNGNFNERIRIRTNDEVGLLAKSFNTMSEQLSYHRAVDNLVSTISRHFVTFQTGDSDEAVNTALGEVARFITADRSAVFLYSDDHTQISKTHSWSRIGLKASPIHHKPYSLDEIPWINESVKNGEVVLVQDVGVFPRDAGIERELWELSEAQSLIFLPLFSNNMLRGFVGFIFVKGNRYASGREEITQILTIIAELISNTLDRKIYEQNIDRARLLLNNVFNAQQSMMIALDENSVVTMWNDAIARFTGIHADTAAAKKIAEVFPSVAPYHKHITGVIRNRKPVHLHHEVLGESKRFCNISFIPLNETEHPGALIIIQDITEETKKDFQLQQAQKMETVRHLASGLSHDFNNAIGGIFATVSYLKYRLSVGHNSREEIEESLELISESSKRSIEMIRRLVSISKKSELNYMPIDLRLIIQNLVQTGRHLFDKSVEIRTDIQAKHTYINGDHTQIEQMLLNLCINACHAMTIMRHEDEMQGGKLTISLTNSFVEAMMHPSGKAGRYFLIKVTDEGVGISEEIRHKIFDPFFTTKDKAHGTGMGLSMVFNTVQQHGGFIDVYSELNVGSTFNVYLPELVDYNKSAESEPEEEIVYAGTGTIFVIDDENVMRNIFSKMLSQCGYRVVTAEDGESAIAAFTEEHASIDLVILDISMPRMSGDQVFARFKEIDSSVPILLTSGFDQDRRVKRIEVSSTAGFLHKPFSIYELSKTVHNIFVDLNKGIDGS